MRYKIQLFLLVLFVAINMSATNKCYNDIKNYVYPENVAKSPKLFSYMPDEKSYLILSISLCFISASK